jgi:Flp pilus assembly protein TadG
MELKARLRAALYPLWKQEDGTLTIEFLILAPIMFWTFIATLAYFDAYRTEAISEKAVMTIADMFSRESDYVDDT